MHIYRIKNDNKNSNSIWRVECFLSQFTLALLGTLWGCWIWGARGERPGCSSLSPYSPQLYWPQGGWNELVLLSQAQLHMEVGRVQLGSRAPPACWSPKWINPAKRQLLRYSRSLWAVAKVFLEAWPICITADFNRLAPCARGIYSVTGEARQTPNEPINYLITNCDACGLGG